MKNEFGQLLKLWRQRLGLSQLELSMQSGISAKHLSFLETGRSSPSCDMIFKVSNCFNLSFEDTNILLRRAGFQAEERQDNVNSVANVLQDILDKHEPYPGVISNCCLEPLMLNQGALKMLSWLDVDFTKYSTIMDMFFSPDGIGPYIVDWNKTASDAVKLIKLKSLAMKDNEDFQSNLKKILSYSEFKNIWDSDDIPSGSTDPIIDAQLCHKGVKLHWRIVLSTFGTPRSVSLDEYQMDFFYPVDEATKQFAYEFL